MGELQIPGKREQHYCGIYIREMIISHFSHPIPIIVRYMFTINVVL